MGRAERPTQDAVRRFLSNAVSQAGLDGFAVTRAEQSAETRNRLTAFVAEGRHGTMEWMAETLERRLDPRAMWNEARSAIVLVQNYGPDVDPLAILDQRDRAAISVYAGNRDYHDVVKGRLKQVAGQFAARFGGDVKVFVDTAPLMEKPLAQNAGLGWQGKHTNLVSRQFGSWLFLGIVLTSLDLEPDEAEGDHCGSCRACLDICPTDAFPAPYQLDARRCISYLTIEHKGPIPVEFRTAMGNRIYGCDDCLAVCPWNKFARVTGDIRLSVRDELRAPALAELVDLNDAAFRAMFSGSPVKRIGRGRFVRNVLIAIGNSAEKAMIPLAMSRLDDEDAIVRGAAVWALSRLMERREFAALAHRARTGETEADVLAEWASGLADVGETV